MLDIGRFCASTENWNAHNLGVLKKKVKDPPHLFNLKENDPPPLIFE